MKDIKHFFQAAFWFTIVFILFGVTQGLTVTVNDKNYYIRIDVSNGK